MTQELIDKFLSVAAFDNKYWESELSSQIDVVINHRYFHQTELIENLVIPEISSDGSNRIKISMICLFKAINRLLERLELMKKSADLGNPYAMFLIANFIEDETEIQKYLESACNLGLSRAVIQYVTNYIKKEYKVDDLYSTQIYDTPIFTELESRITTDLSKFHNIESIENSSFWDSLADIYYFLNSGFSGDKYLDQLVYCRYRSDNLDYYQNRSEINAVIHRNYTRAKRIDLLEKENMELKAAYEELKKLKELDFNNLISNQVGEYLIDS